MGARSELTRKHCGAQRRSTACGDESGPLNCNRFGPIFAHNRPSPWDYARMAQCERESKMRMVCGECGSDQIVREAWAEWDERVQGWQLGAVFDFAWCHRCQRPAPITARPV